MIETNDHSLLSTISNSFINLVQIFLEVLVGAYMSHFEFGSVAPVFSSGIQFDIFKEELSCVTIVHDGSL